MPSLSVTRRKALAVICSGAGALVLAACGSASPTSSATNTAAPAAPSQSASQGARTSAVAAPASAQPKAGGSLRLGRTDDLSKLEPHALAPGPRAMLFMIFDRLIEYDDNSHPQPSLAESWDLSSNGQQLKLNLRKGVQFHTGREMTSEDIKYNMLRVRDPKVNTQTAEMSKWFQDIQTPDKSTVVLVSDKPRPGVFDLLEYLNIVDKNTIEGPDATSKLVGTGPFAFAEWLTGQHVHATKNKSYWQSGRPYLDEVTWNIVKDPQSMVAQFEAGALDVIDSPPFVDIVRLKTNGQYQHAVNEQGGIVYLMSLNTTTPPTNNKMIRQALDFAIDRKRFVDTILQGQGTVTSLPWKSLSEAYDAQKASAYSFDLDKAGALVRQSGVSDLSLDFNYPTQFSEIGSFAQIYQADLAKIGITLTLKSMDFGGWSTATQSLTYKGISASFTTFGNVAPFDLPLTSIFWNVSKNAAGYDNPQYAQLVGEASTEVDATKRKSMYSRLNDLILDDTFTIPYANALQPLLMTQNVHDLRKTVIDSLPMVNSWLG
jgi:peptide/nickel transport system substrate-binding protein